MLEWMYYVGPEMPVDYVFWEDLEGTPFTQGVRDTLVSGLSETRRSSVVVVPYRLWQIGHEQF